MGKSNRGEKQGNKKKNNPRGGGRRNEAIKGKEGTPIQNGNSNGGCSVSVCSQYKLPDELQAKISQLQALEL